MIKIATPYAGRNAMKLRLEDLTPEAWTTIYGEHDTQKRRFVPILRKCLNYRINTIGSMPWMITNRGGQVLVDSSTNDFRPDQKPLRYLIKAITNFEKSMIYSSRVYYLKPESRVLDSRLMEPVWDSEFGIVSFRRKAQNGEYFYIPVEDMIYIWESGQSETEPIESIIQTVQTNVDVIQSLNTFVEMFFKNGAIKATIVSVDGYPTEDERKRLDSFLQRTVTGLKNAFRNVVLRVPVTVNTIGSGLGKEDFDSTLIDQQIMSIITGFEVPPSGVLPSAANYATAISDKRQFIETVAIPRCNWFADEINLQYLEEMDLLLKFTPENLSVMQEDENNRSIALLNLVNAGFNVLDAAEILGYTIPEAIITKMQSEENHQSDMQNDEQRINNIVGSILQGNDKQEYAKFLNYEYTIS